MTNQEYVQKYVDLITEFTDGEMTASTFSEKYINLFLQDEDAPNKEIFRHLDYLFAEADAYCEPKIRDDVRGSIDENELLEAANRTMTKLDI